MMEYKWDLPEMTIQEKLYNRLENEFKDLRVLDRRTPRVLRIGVFCWLLSDYLGIKKEQLKKYYDCSSGHVTHAIKRVHKLRTEDMEFRHITLEIREYFFKQLNEINEN